MYNHTNECMDNKDYANRWNINRLKRAYYTTEDRTQVDGRLAIPKTSENNYFLRVERCSIGRCTLQCFTRVMYIEWPVARNAVLQNVDFVRHFYCPAVSLRKQWRIQRGAGCATAPVPPPLV